MSPILRSLVASPSPFLKLPPPGQQYRPATSPHSLRASSIGYAALEAFLFCAQYPGSKARSKFRTNSSHLCLQLAQSGPFCTNCRLEGTRERGAAEREWPRWARPSGPSRRGATLQGTLALPTGRCIFIPAAQAGQKYPPYARGALPDAGVLRCISTRKPPSPDGSSRALTALRRL